MLVLGPLRVRGSNYTDTIGLIGVMIANMDMRWKSAVMATIVLIVARLRG